MAHLTIYRETTPDSTVVSNLFIDEYMRDANDAQLKVYFYLLRMMNARQATSVSDIADKFNHTEKDVLRALKYWQGLKLLDLDYDLWASIYTICLPAMGQAPFRIPGRLLPSFPRLLPQLPFPLSPLRLRRKGLPPRKILLITRSLPIPPTS